MKHDKEREAANLILEDRHGADYYQDCTILSNFLSNALNFDAEEAKSVAKSIQEDRRGANFYQDVEILANFLRR